VSQLLIEVHKWYNS